MKLTSSLAVLSLAAFGVACSGGSSSSLGGSGSLTPGASITAQFIDAPVAGLKIELDGESAGTTNSNGSFKCKQGEEVGFVLGLKEIGKATCGAKIYVDDLTDIPDGGTTDQVAALIQAVSNEVNGKLVIVDDVADLVGGGLNISNVDDAMLENINDDRATPRATAVTMASARAHVNSNLPGLANANGLEALVANGKNFITMEKTSGSDDDCWRYMTGELEVTKQEVGDKSVYRMNITKSLGFDNEEVLPADWDDLVCFDSMEDFDDSTDYECYNQSISRVISSTKSTYSRLFKKSFDMIRGDAIGCVFGDLEDDGYYVMNLQPCEEDSPGITARLLSAFQYDGSYGYSLTLESSDTKNVFIFNERGFSVDAVESSYVANESFGTDDAGPAARLRATTYSCSYRYEAAIETKFKK